MVRLIDADRLERVATCVYIQTCNELTSEQIDAVAKFTGRIIGEIESAPTHKVEPAKHGRWVHKYGDGHEEPAITGGECSICGYLHTATNYCPNCGAKMDEVEE